MYILFHAKCSYRAQLKSEYQFLFRFSICYRLYVIKDFRKEVLYFVTSDEKTISDVYVDLNKVVFALNVEVIYCLSFCLQYMNT